MGSTHKQLIYVEKNDVMQAVIRLLANREHSKAELLKKLSSRCDDADLLEEAIGECQAKGYQSDLRYAQMILRVRIEQCYGLLRVQQDLYRKGLERELIYVALEKEEIDWFEVSVECFNRKYARQFDHRSVKSKEKCIRSMAARGFSLDEIYYAINSFLEAC